MDALEFIGFACSFLIGIVLGLVGGGGSILTTPVVVYLFGINEEVATSYSLFVVGTAALVGVIQRVGTQFIAFKEGLLFAIPSTITGFFMRSLVVPNMPEELSFYEYIVSKETLIMGVLGILMLFTSTKMLFSKQKYKLVNDVPYNLVITFGVAVGLLAGFVGAGGGFLIVPALIFMGLPTKKAMGTSMLVITIQSSITFLGDFNNEKIMGEGGLDWSLLFILTGLTIAGVFIGGLLNKHIKGSVLKKAFGVLVLLVGTFIILEKLNIIKL